MMQLKLDVLRSVIDLHSSTLDLLITIKLTRRLPCEAQQNEKCYWPCNQGRGLNKLHHI